jgi:hypothetical protein
MSAIGTHSAWQQAVFRPSSWNPRVEPAGSSQIPCVERCGADDKRVNYLAVIRVVHVLSFAISAEWCLVLLLVSSMLSFLPGQCS